MTGPPLCDAPRPISPPRTAARIARTRMVQPHPPLVNIKIRTRHRGRAKQPSLTLAACKRKRKRTRKGKRTVNPNSKTSVRAQVFLEHSCCKIGVRKASRDQCWQGRSALPLEMAGRFC
jgi:hypothetical protein